MSGIPSPWTVIKLRDCYTRFPLEELRALKERRAVKAFSSRITYINRLNPIFGNIMYLIRCFSVLYKDLQWRKVEEVPEGLSRATIWNAFHSHDLKSRSLYTVSRITESSSEGPNSTKSSSLNPKSNVTTAFTLTCLKDGIGAVIE